MKRAVLSALAFAMMLGFAVGCNDDKSKNTDTKKASTVIGPIGDSGSMPTAPALKEPPKK